MGGLFNEAETRALYVSAGAAVAEAMRERNVSRRALGEGLGLTDPVVRDKLAGRRPWFLNDMLGAAWVLRVDAGTLFADVSPYPRPSADQVDGPAGRI
ncbi:hypothetical protein ACHAAC_17065 [Aeromicrobium sp. CF4.19]|uniref:hypothetical protein n=1 Tax=Aeromicrobium sp. CF4.19 TaxID=3373082 RepID=UPI003EE80586